MSYMSTNYLVTSLRLDPSALIMAGASISILSAYLTIQAETFNEFLFTFPFMTGLGIGCVVMLGVCIVVC